MTARLAYQCAWRRRRAPLMLLCLFAAVAVTLTDTVATAEPLPTDELVTQYRTYDAARNGGMGYANYTAAETLAWSEGYILMDYVRMYRVTRDETWLRKITEHFDVMLANATDHDNDGYKGWQTDRYSCARVYVVSSQSANATVTPTEPLISDIARAHRVTGHQYEVRFALKAAYTITDRTTASLVVKLQTLVNGLITGIPEVTVRVSGTPALGDRFVIQTVAPVPFGVHGP